MIDTGQQLTKTRGEKPQTTTFVFFSLQHNLDQYNPTQLNLNLRHCILDQWNHVEILKLILSDISRKIIRRTLRVGE